MNVVKLILARTFKDAHAFANEHLGLVNGQYRVVTSPSTLTAIRNADLYLVPGWDKRPDRFSLKGALRYTRLNQIEVPEDWNTTTAQTPQPTPVVDDLQPAGVQLTVVTADEASAFVTALPDDIDYPLDQPSPPDAGDVFDEAAATISPIEVPVAREPALERTDIMQALADDAAAADEPSAPTDVPAEPAVKRRRRKCKDCSELHFKEEPCKTAGAE